MLYKFTTGVKYKFYGNLILHTKGYATQSILWAYSIKAFIQMLMDSIVIIELETVLTIITKMMDFFGRKVIATF